VTPKEAITDFARSDDRLQIDPGFTEQELHILEHSIPAPPLPPETRELLLFTRGFSLPGAAFPFPDGVGFWGFGFGLERVFALGNALCDDGSGNAWVVDVSQRTGEWGPVFYVCHDPPVALVQSATLTDFIHGILQAAFGGEERWLAELDKSVTEMWRNRKGLEKVMRLYDSTDPFIKKFVQSLDERWLVADLRRREPATGFAWGCFGPDTIIQRFGSELLFAIAPPVRSRGFLRRLFS
jgi:hypothetical protein